MRHFLLTITAVLALCCFSTEASAQYTAVGVRLGSPISASFKFFPGESGNAIEAFVGYRSRKVNFGFGSFGWTSINVGGLYQVHKELEITEGLKWYTGGGASAYFWSFDDGFADSDSFASVSLGLHGNAGLDYEFPNAPINLSLDWVPTFFVGSGFSTGFSAGFGALSVRYVLK